MAFVQLEDLTGTIEAVAFPEVYKNHMHDLEEDKILAIKAKIKIRDGARTLMLESVKEV